MNYIDDSLSYDEYAIYNIDNYDLNRSYSNINSIYMDIETIETI